MKRIIKIILFCLFPVFTMGQKSTIQGDFYSQAKGLDFSKLWRADKLKMIGEKTPPIDFPEPLGYIGSDFYRFYIHYITVKKDTVNPYKYWVTGKTRVDNNICSFSGTIIINSVSFFKESNLPPFKELYLTADIYFKEDSTQKGSGFIKGKLESSWYLDKNGAILYDTINAYADGFSNNEVRGAWTSYATHKSKKCNWGDFRIPESKGLDIGAGEFGVSDYYVKNGWLNYHNMDMGDNKAKTEEKRKWWK